MSWYPVFRLGPLNGELDFVCKVQSYSVTEDNIETEDRNLSGATLKSYLRANVPTITLNVAMLPDASAAIIRGMQTSLSALNFIFNKTLAVKYLQATSASTTSIVIPPTSATGIVITGVYAATDYSQSGTNYYSAGSTFDATTGTITVATPLVGTNTDVLVNYTFSGTSCFVKAALSPHTGDYSGYWQGNITLTGA